jgi:hypothetical protein
MNVIGELDEKLQKSTTAITPINYRIRYYHKLTNCKNDECYKNYNYDYNVYGDSEDNNNDDDDDDDDDDKTESIESINDIDTIIIGKSEENRLEKVIKYTLEEDVYAILEYRRKCDPINKSTFLKWFGVKYESNAEQILSWLKTYRDFVYNSNGLNTLKTHYLYNDREPIQYCMLRMAMLFSEIPINVNVLDSADPIDTTVSTRKTTRCFTLWKIFYDLISCNFIHVPKKLAYISLNVYNNFFQKSIKNINNEDTIANFIKSVTSANKQKDYIRLFSSIEMVTQYISFDMGINIWTPYILNSNNDEEKYRNKDTTSLYDGTSSSSIKDFKNLCETLNSLNLLTMHNVKSNITMHLHVHSVLIFDLLKLSNITYNLLLSDYFMECVQQNKMWYLFDENISSLNTCPWFEYEEHYRYCVISKLYTQAILARSLFSRIINAIVSKDTATPSIVWYTTINQFNNHRSIGNVSGLNLQNGTCITMTQKTDNNTTATTTNDDNDDNSNKFKELKSMRNGIPIATSSLDINVSMMFEFPKVLDNIYKYCQTLNKPINDDIINNVSIYEKYTFALGYLCTLGLNNYLTKYFSSDTISKSINMTNETNKITTTEIDLKFRTKNERQKYLQKQQYDLNPKYIRYLLWRLNKEHNRKPKYKHVDKIIDDNDNNPRQISINLIGLYDLTVMINGGTLHDLNCLKGRLYEYMYLGGIESSCEYYRQYNLKCSNFDYSPFSMGLTQMSLQNYNRCKFKSWSDTEKRMIDGMANSMLTVENNESFGTTANNLIALDVQRVNRLISELTPREYINYGCEFVYLNQTPSSCLMGSELMSLALNSSRQIELYAKSAPFIDNLQIATIKMENNWDLCYELVVRNFVNKLKTCIIVID